MKIFMTGGSGFVGTGVVHELTSAGHAVRGLARSEDAATKLANAGVVPVRGDLSDVDLLRREAAEADAAIHCGFVHDFTNFAAAVETDRKAIEAMLAGVRRDKVFVATSGTGLVRGSGILTEDLAAPEQSRGANESLVLGEQERGVRTALVRLPPSVHGAGDHGFVPTLMDLARQTGVAAFIGSGDNRWPAVHRDDAAVLYRLAIEGLLAGTLPSRVRLHAVGETGVAFREIAEAIAARLGLGTATRDAAHFRWFSHFAGLDGPASAEITERLTGWRATRTGLVADIRSDAYADAHGLPI